MITENKSAEWALSKTPKWYMAKKIEYLTPAQIIEKYPELEQKFGWTAKDVGLLLKNKLLQGHYNHSLRKSMIKEDSLKKLIHFANQQIENQMVVIT